jgi:hypothetical protein
MALCGLFASGLVTGDVSAYQSFYTPLFQNPVSDPCNVQGIADSGGLVVRRQPALGSNDIERRVALLCGPVYTAPALSTLLADDAIWQRRMGGSGGAPRHMLQGGQDSLPWKPGLSTTLYPAFKGPGGNALGWKDAIKIDRNVQKVRAAAQGVVTSLAGATFTLCVIGAIQPAALPVCAAGVVVSAVALALTYAPELINLISRYFQRNEAMNNGQWFVWSSGSGFFNGFGDVDQSWINPSLFSASDNAQMRVGVVFSNVLLNQGPDFDLSRRGAAAASRPRRLDALVQQLERPEGRTRAGTRRDERLFGGRRGDHLFAGGGDDRVFGRRGHDVLLQGAMGDDRILGAAGNDNIDGHRGRDVLSGGPGNDQIIDFFGKTTVYSGRGTDLIAVRDGRSDDTVVCKGPGRKRILADPGDRIVKAGSRLTGRAACPTGSQLVTDGRLPRIGRGY